MASQRRAPTKRPPRPAAKKPPPPPDTSEGADGAASVTDTAPTNGGTALGMSAGATDTMAAEGADAQTSAAAATEPAKVAQTKAQGGPAASKSTGRPTPAKSGGKGTAKAAGTAARSATTTKSTGTAVKGGATSAKGRPAGGTPKPGSSGPNYRPPTGAARSASRLPPPHKKKRFDRKAIMAVIGVVLIGTLIIFFAFAVNGASKSPTGGATTTGPEGIPVPVGAKVLAAVNSAQYPSVIDGISCNTTEQLVYHIHVHLTIFVNGSARTIPYGIGITPPLQLSATDGTFVDGGTCFYWLHTHADDGIIHVESPTQKTYTLGQFFDEWGQPLTSNQVGPAQGKLTIYQDGKLYTGDPRNLQLTAHNQIQLDVGTPAPTQSLVTNWGQL